MLQRQISLSIRHFTSPVIPRSLADLLISCDKSGQGLRDKDVTSGKTSAVPEGALTSRLEYE